MKPLAFCVCHVFTHIRSYHVFKTVLSFKPCHHLSLWSLQGETIGLERYTEDGQWKLIATSAYNFQTDLNQNGVVISLTLERRTTFYILAIIMPVHVPVSSVFAWCFRKENGNFIILYLIKRPF